ncbi:hypothetical protein FM076_32080 [Streptomyces albus subsp. chlorinus]|uniref:hypothetical protein n=1 Tax=Streptomyces albus TaxID=1888 RepID=UPI00156E0480|nr:hypothetical protein [Streptomyces albus]NSC25545.1 hypothetical protein [Streptomyces albus subsp. chlorinus]
MDSTREAADLLTALAAAASSFRQAGYAIYLSHQTEVRWRQFSHYGGEEGAPCASLGFTIALQDGRELCVSATVAVNGQGFSVAADATIDDASSEPQGEQRFLIDLPDAAVATVPECVTVLRDYVEQLTLAAPGLVREALLGPKPDADAAPV